MSKNFEKIKKYYEEERWTKQMVYNVVGKKSGITEEEYELIVGEKYESIQ